MGEQSATSEAKPSGIHITRIFDHTWFVCRPVANICSHLRPSGHLVRPIALPSNRCCYDVIQAVDDVQAMTDTEDGRKRVRPAAPRSATLRCVVNHGFDTRDRDAIAQAVEEVEAMTDAETVADVCGQLQQMFGLGFRDPVATHVTRWLSDPRSLGAYSYVPANGKRVRLSCVLVCLN